jgi:hypothetical protein
MAIEPFAIGPRDVVLMPDDFGLRHGEW